MSRQTINALYRFTHDLMKRAGIDTQPKIERNDPVTAPSKAKGDASPAPKTKLPAADAPGDEIFGSGVGEKAPQHSLGTLGDDRLWGREPPAPPSGQSMSGPAPEPNHNVLGENDPNTYGHGAPGAHAPASPAGGGIDPQLLQALLGGGAGALAGYGLGGAFQDEDDDSQPWLSTLAGTAAGGVGLPMLMQYLSQQGANPAPPGGAPPAPAPVPPKTI